MPRKARIITVGLQKGGVGKTTSSAIISYLLSLDYKVLAVDMDTQGNLSELLLQSDVNQLVEDGSINGTIYEALTERNPSRYTVSVLENLDLLASTDHLALLPDYIVENVPRGQRALVLKETLDKVSNQYDFIIIDTPPSLSQLTTNALGASDGVLVLFECSLFSKSALNNFFDTIAHVQQVNSNLEVIGILPTMLDRRRSDAKILLQQIREDDFFGKYVLSDVITRKAATGRLPIMGFKENPELLHSVEQYVEVVKELMERVIR